MYTVKLTYFKESGKYYTDITFETEFRSLLDIWEYVKTSSVSPGLTCKWDGYTLIDVPEHPHSHPKLLIP